MARYELIPNDSHKSFYGKAFVERDANGAETLYSYGTRIIERDVNGNLWRVWSGWSATTGRHVKAFCGLNKAAFVSLPYIWERDTMQAAEHRPAMAAR